MRCRPTSIKDTKPRPYQLTRWRRRRPGGCPPPSPNLQNIPIRTEEGTKASAPPSWRRRATSWSRPITRRSSCGCSPTSPTFRNCRQAFADGVDIHAHHRLGDVRRAGRGHAGRYPATRQGDQFRHRLRHLGLRAGEPALHPARARPAPTSSAISSAFPASADYMDARPRSLVPRDRATSTTLFGRVCHYPDITDLATPRSPGRRRAAGDQRADPGHGGRHHPPRHGAHGRRAGRQGSCRRSMLLQVHDELVFEVPDDEIDATLPVIRARDGSRRRTRPCSSRCRSRSMRAPG